MHKLRWLLWGTIVVLWVLALVNLGWSVEAYAGGTALSMQEDGFSWTGNVFMELGRMKAYNLADNSVAEQFWVRFLLLSGLGMTILHLMWLLNMRVHQARLFAGAAFLLVALGAFHSYGLRLYPYDTAYSQFYVFWERMAAGYAFGAMATGVAMKIEPDCRQFHAYAWWGVGILALFHLSLVKWGPEMWSAPAMLTIHALLEKIVIASYIGVWLMHLRLRYKKLKRNSTSFTPDSAC